MSNSNSNNCAGSGSGSTAGGGGTVTGTTYIGGGGGGGGGTGISGTTGGYTITIPQWVGPITWVPQGIPEAEEAVPETKKSAKSDGCSCKKCKEYYPYAEPNQEDGTLICYGCRHRW
jgi:hypothetical protein